VVQKRGGGGDEEKCDWRMLNFRREDEEGSTDPVLVVIKA